MSDWRELTDWERAVLMRLLAIGVPDRDEFVRQLKGCRVRSFDKHGCIEFEGSDLPQVDSLLVEASASDEDGVPLGLLLFVKGDVLRELEINRWDGGHIIRLPDASEWQIEAPPDEKGSVPN